ncbi:MAG: sigma-70 family RNA polymerase sigma factor [Candidatus Margulisiibacteriota bacterium]|nr:sigma-70 family RNA polymerase sigma factor [Candidatus Margulisiibacteriota bacterium]
MAKSGDRRAIETLLACNQRYVYKIAGRYAWTGVPMSDLVQQGNIGLIQAIKKFDPEKGVKFITYAHYWILSLVKECLRDNEINTKDYKERPFVLSFESLPPELFPKSINYDGMVLFGEVLVQMGKLPERLKMVLDGHFIEAMTLDEIGHEMGISGERARQLEQRALNLIREQIVRKKD